VSRLKSSLPESLAASVKSAMREWQTGGNMKRLWQRDASLWTGTDEARGLGWLDVADQQIAQIADLRKIVDEVHDTGFKHVFLLGMGGSSLGPEVLQMTLGKPAGFPELHVPDSTDPARAKTFENKIELAERGRRALRVHLGTNVHAGLTKLHRLVKKALTA
jgi:transaldolase/glucose-6-phosphate isomerase